MPLPPLHTFANLPAAKQDSVTRVCLEEFSENGYQRTSINTIVKRLGIAKGSIFQYFRDKEGLFLFVFNMSLEKVKGHLKQVREDTEGMVFFDRLERTLQAGVRFIGAQPLVYRLYLRVLFESQIPFRQEILLAIRRYSHDYLRGMVTTAQARGELRQDLDPDMAAFVLDAVLDRFLQAQCVEHLDAGLGLFDMPLDAADRWIARIVEAIRSGIAAPPRNDAPESTKG